MGYREKQKARLQFQERFRDQTGVPKHGNSVERKRRAIIRTYEEPALPKLAAILFISMFVLTAVMVAVDLKNGLLYIEQLGVARLLGNLSQTGLIIWVIYTILIAPVCVIGMRKNIAVVRRKAREGSSNVWSEEDHARCARTARRLNAPYRKYLLCSALGTVVWLFFHIAVVLWAAP